MEIQLAEPAASAPLPAHPANPLPAVLGRLWAYVEIGRPAETAVVVAGTLIGSWLAGIDGRGSHAVLAITGSNAALFGGAMVVNDWRDFREDAINKPARPIPSGRVPRGHALLLGATLFLAGIAAAGWTGPGLGLAAFGLTLVSLAYVLWLKGIPLLGNGTVALVSAYPLWCWMPLAPRIGRSYLALVLSCLLFRLGAEIVKTAEDFPGDDAAGLLTLATWRGVPATNRIGATCLCLALLPCWLLFLSGEAGPRYAAFLLLATLVAAAAAVRARQTTPAAASRLLVSAERAIMFLVILALFLR